MKRSCRPSCSGQDAVNEAHNTLLQALFTVGIIGAAPLIAALAVLVYRGITRPNPARGLFTFFCSCQGWRKPNMCPLQNITLVALLVYACDAVGRRVQAGSWLQAP